MESFCVYQTFTITFRGKYNGPLFVTFKRSPNGQGHLYEMTFWSDSCALYPVKLFLEKEELTYKEFNAIHVKAAKLWDQYWTVPDVKVAEEWLKSKEFAPLLKKAEGDMA